MRATQCWGKNLPSVHQRKLGVWLQYTLTSVSRPPCVRKTIGNSTVESRDTFCCMQIYTSFRIWFTNTYWLISRHDLFSVFFGLGVLYIKKISKIYKGKNTSNYIKLSCMHVFVILGFYNNAVLGNTFLINFKNSPYLGVV